MVNPQDCLFCKIVKNEIPSKRIYKDTDTIAILDINPASHGHTLVIPKKHFSTIYDIDDHNLASLIKTAKIMASRMKNKLNAEGVNILQNNGRHAGQMIDHIYFHVIPRYTNDNIVLQFPRVQMAEPDLKAMQDKLREEDKPAASYGPPGW
jgi:histidine triad (HIT) family protein